MMGAVAGSSSGSPKGLRYKNSDVRGRPHLKMKRPVALMLVALAALALDTREVSACTCAASQEKQTESQLIEQVRIERDAAVASSQPDIGR